MSLKTNVLHTYLYISLSTFWVIFIGMEALCIYLKRLAYPNRLADLRNYFGRSTSALSEIANFVNSHIYENFGHLLEDLNNLPWLNQNRLEQYANVSLIE